MDDPMRTLGNWLHIRKNRLDQFLRWWTDRHEKDPRAYPDTLPPYEWTRLFNEFLHCLGPIVRVENVSYKRYTLGLPDAKGPWYVTTEWSPVRDCYMANLWFTDNHLGLCGMFEKEPTESEVKGVARLYLLQITKDW